MLGRFLKSVAKQRGGKVNAFAGGNPQQGVRRQVVERCMFRVMSGAVNQRLFGRLFGSAGNWIHGLGGALPLRNRAIRKPTNRPTAPAHRPAHSAVFLTANSSTGLSKTFPETWTAA